MTLAKLWVNGYCHYLGVFESKARATAAIKLHKLWLERGYTEIPKGNGYKYRYGRYE